MLWWPRSRRPGAPARSATARFSSLTSTMRSGSARASAGKPPCELFLGMTPKYHGDTERTDTEAMFHRDAPDEQDERDTQSSHPGSPVYPCEFPPCPSVS